MLTVIVGTNEFSLDDGSLVNLVAHDGLGMTPLHRISERGPLQHGETDRGYRLDPRKIQLVFQFPSTVLSDMYSKRATLLSYLKPQNNPKLKFALPNGDIRQIDGHLASDFTMPWSPDLWAAQKVALTVNCPDPTFYDPDMVSISMGISAGGTGFGIPWVIPWTLGESTLDKTTAIVYSGTFLTYPIIYIYGPITNPIVTNTTTNEKLDFTGISIGAGNYYKIDCRYGIKTVVNDAGTNKIADLSADSDLTTFHIADDPEAVGGSNSIRIQGTGANTQTQVYIQFFNRYIGL